MRPVLRLFEILKQAIASYNLGLRETAPILPSNDDTRTPRRVDNFGKPRIVEFRIMLSSNESSW